MQAVIKQTVTVLEMIKFQHTVFALPFALTSMLIASAGWPQINTILWVVAACFFARSAAMGFNRWADSTLDKRNPRTSTRAIPAGLLSPAFVMMFVIACIVGFIFSAAMLNPLALLLSPVAILILLGYSYTKRFTSLAHFVLGLALALAPVGAWVAVRGEIGITAVLLGLAVMNWTAGFDLIYSCQDIDIDKKEQLFSIPSRYGPQVALQLSRFLYFLTVLLFILAGYMANQHWPYYTAVAGATALLVAEHAIVNTSDTRRINLAFFTINSWVGMVILAGTILEYILY